MSRVSLQAEGRPSVPTDLVERLEVVRADHLRLASWNRGKDRPARVAFHHDAAQAIATILNATTASAVGMSASECTQKDQPQ